MSIERITNNKQQANYLKNMNGNVNSNVDLNVTQDRSIVSVESLNIPHLAVSIHRKPTSKVKVFEISEEQVHWITVFGLPLPKGAVTFWCVPECFFPFLIDCLPILLYTTINTMSYLRIWDIFFWHALGRAFNYLSCEDFTFDTIAHRLALSPYQKQIVFFRVYLICVNFIWYQCV